MCVLYVYLCTKFMCCPQKPEEGTRALGIGVPIMHMDGFRRLELGFSGREASALNH